MCPNWDSTQLLQLGDVQVLRTANAGRYRSGLALCDTDCEGKTTGDRVEVNKVKLRTECRRTEVDHALVARGHTWDCSHSLGRIRLRLDDGARSERLDAFRGQRTAADGELGCCQR